MSSCHGCVEITLKEVLEKKGDSKPSAKYS